MANPLKGQIKINLASKEYTARLTIDALMQIEDALGEGIIKVASRMGEGDVRIKDLVTVLLPALRGGGNDLQANDINKIVQDAGIVQATKSVAMLLAQTLTDDSGEESGGEKAEGKQCHCLQRDTWKFAQA